MPLYSSYLPAGISDRPLRAVATIFNRMIWFTINKMGNAALCFFLQGKGKECLFNNYLS